MGKKKEAKEAKALFKAQEKSEYEWAKKRGKEYPLSLADQQLYQQEKFIQQRFWEMKDILIKGNTNNITSKPVSTDNNTPKPWPLWTYDDVISDEKLYHLMPEAIKYKAIHDIGGIFHDGFSYVPWGYIVLNLSEKYQEAGNDNGGDTYGFERASIMVSPSRDVTRHLYVGDNDKVDAGLYTGWFNGIDHDDEDLDPWDDRRISFLVFTDKDKQHCAVELEEFCVLAEIEENKEYIFTLFNRAQDLLFTVTLSGLKDVDFIIENGKAAVIEKGEKGNNVNGKNNYIGQTFGKLTAIKPTGKTVAHGRVWLFQCTCGNKVEAAISDVKTGRKNSCGCLSGESRLKDITGQRFSHLTATRRLERKSKCEPYLWECACDCGRTTTATVAKLNSGAVKSCGCARYEKSKLDIKGQKFGRLTAIAPTGERNNGRLLWLFQCSCGKKTTKPASDVRRGAISSCGCLNKEMAAKRMPDVQKHSIFAEGTHISQIASDRLNSNNTSGVKGVSWKKHWRKWISQIRFQKKDYMLGAFDNIEDAAHARKMAEKRYFKPIIEKYMGTGKKPNFDSESGKRQKDIPEENIFSIATGYSTEEKVKIQS